MKSQNLFPKAIFAIFPFRALVMAVSLLSLFIAIFGPMSARAGEMRALRGHVPPAAALLQPLGRLPGTNSLRLAISLPLRNGGALASLLQRLYDPASPDYHQYLTPAQFTERFGPTAQDYQSVIHFAGSNGLEIVATRESRMLLDIQGKVSDIEKAFHVTLRTYRHPSEARQFYAPDVEPTVEADLPVLDIVGLGDFAVPRPMLHPKPRNAKPVSASGSQQPNGYYLGSDFRNAYAPGVSLTGAGQMVGLLELDGYYSNDIVSYETLAGLTNVPLINVDADNYTGPPGSGVDEVSLDIEMAIAMAPGLAAVVVFQAGQSTGVTGFDDILDSMAASNQIKQFSSSWGYTGFPDPNTTTDGWLQKLAVQGQSFFQASGDGDAWVNPIWVPADSPYLTSVGGTSLTMNGSGASYSSEMVWNEGNLGSQNGWAPNGNGYWGSGGGASTVYSIPYWQQGISNSFNHASTTMRNIPDVALTAYEIWVIYGNGQSGAFGGTSCAAPLWAGFIALANQQAASNSTSVGFINPAIYALGQGSSYTSLFNDIITGNNINGQSQGLYSAVPGYDLCTGWGTPNGTGLINALLSPALLLITPFSGFVSSGHFGGPFSVTNQNFTLTNIGAVPLNWSLANTSSWLSVSSSSGALTSGGAASVVSAGLNSAATLLSPGAYTNTLWFTNLNDGMAQSRQFILTVSKAAPRLSWNTPSAVTYGTALSSIQLDATASVPGGFAYNPSAGAVLNTGSNILTVIFTPTNTVDYSSATDTVKLAVSRVPLTVKASNTSRVYGQTNPVFTGTITGLQNGDNITATYSCSATTNSAVGTYAITPTLVDPGHRQTNYIVALSNGTLTVTMAAPLLSWATPSAVTYGTALSSNQLDATANVPGNFAYNPSAGTVLDVGTNSLSVNFTPANTVDYSSAADGVSLVVSPAPLTVTASNASQVYGQSNPVFTGTITGLQNGDNITATYSCSATSNSPVGTYSITPALVDPDNRQTNYAVSLSNGTLTVTMAAPVLSWSTPSAVTYGTALDTNQLDATANVPGNFAYGPSAGAALDTGTNILSVIFTPDDAVDYSSATGNVSLVVSPAPLTVTTSNASQVYGQNSPVFTGTITGLQNGDNITATYSCSATTNSPVGMYAITPALVDPDNRRTNYTVGLSNGTLTVTMATPLLSWATPSAVTYGTALDTNQLDATANVPGSFDYNPSAGTVLSPGTNSLGVLFIPEDAVDYSNATGNVSLVVLVVPIALNIQLAGDDVVLCWNDPASVFALQAAPAATGVFTNVPDAASPYTNAITGAQQFFQLASQTNLDSAP
jgi:subtilase family serine protease